MSALQVVIHGHFYQPPREDPWNGFMDVEPNAAPDRDWNERIDRECYTPLTAIKVGEGDDAPRISAYDFMSFDAGPTLLAWMERESPPTYAAILAGDRAGLKRRGAGNAVAMPFHHVILPLCSRRDKQTEVRWGIADFERRFGRRPEGMWLPETAVDSETLDVIAEAGIQFTILAPHQVAVVPDDGLPGVIKTESGRDIVVFLYDGQLSHGIAFGDLLKDSFAWQKAVLERRTSGLVSMATDGETFGHHHKFGDLALGALLQHLRQQRGVLLANFAAVLAERPPLTDVTLVEPSSWSCVHGVGRWSRDCGCRIGPGASQQHWRAPLRTAIDWLLNEVHRIYERDGAALPGGPWAFRDAAGALGSPQDPEERLINMERNALRAETSCGWFFDDFAGLEGRQVLRHAARAIALSGDAQRLEAGLLERLAGAVSNDPKEGTAVEFYRRRIKSEHPA